MELLDSSTVSQSISGTDVHVLQLEVVGSVAPVRRPALLLLRLGRGDRLHLELLLRLMTSDWTVLHQNRLRLDHLLRLLRPSNILLNELKAIDIKIDEDFATFVTH